MKNNPKLGLYGSSFVLIGFPVFFLIISLITGQWRYLIFSIPPSMAAGLTCLIISLQQLKAGINKQLNPEEAE